jgi:hypothetical protein
MIEVDARHKSFSKFRFQYFGTPKSDGFSVRRSKQPAENGKESSGVPSTLNRLHIDTISPYGYNGESIRNFHIRLSVCNQRCNQNVIKIDYIIDYSHAIPGTEFRHRKCGWFSLVHGHTPTLCCSTSKYCRTSSQGRSQPKDSFHYATVFVGLPKVRDRKV